MKIIRYIKGGELIQLGIDGKELHLKWGLAPKPMRLGQLKDIKMLASEKETEFNGVKVKVPFIVKQMAKSITYEGLQLADKYTDEEFYNDFFNDYKDMDEAGELKLIGEFDEWV